MKWVAAAFTGWATGALVFILVWALLVAYFAKDEADKRTPPWPVMWAMSIAFMVIALSWAGFFREVFRLPVSDDTYEQRD